MSDRKIRVVIADDHPVARAGVTAMLATQPDLEVVAAAEDGATAVTLAKAHRPDVVVVDMRMPVLDGVSVTMALNDPSLHLRVIILSHYDGEDDVWRALKAGARGYLPKSTRGEALIDAIRAVARGERYLPAELTARMAEHVGQQDLSHREKQVLEAVFAGHSNKEIASSLNITERTVALHVSNMMAKLGAKSRTEAVAVALSRGILKA